MLRYQEQEQQKQNLLTALKDCTDEQEFQQLQQDLFNLNKQMKQDKEEYEGKVSTALKSLSELEIDFAKLMASHVYNPDDVKAYAEQQGWIKPSNVVSKEGDQLANKQSKRKDEAKEPLIIGTFNFADYGFEMPKNAKGEPMSNDTSFEWDWNKNYIGRGWQPQFIKAITAKGYEHVVANASPQFKDWLAQFKEGQKAKAGQKIYENKRDFLNRFGIKPADADKIDFNFGSEESKGEAQAASHAKRRK
jgi:hypothetical protein